MDRYEVVIGLEVHAQLRTRTKIFCGCATTFGALPNSQTCPVCLGHPGALPVLNAEVVHLALRGALALGCDVHTTSIFARKNYFYPDLPKGYQISQFDLPIATGGSVPIETAGGPRRIPLRRFHLEEDAGKSLHEGMPDSERYSYVDLNRAGVPLAEIVSEPELHDPEEAYLYLQRMRSTLRYTGVCDGNMEEGSLRCDANISLRPRGATELGTRTELKNLNSFRNVQRALEFEIARQAAVLDAGGHVVQETVLWDAGAGETRPMRGKEEAHDYRYFPEPDLLPLIVDPADLERVRAEIPELPAERKERFLAVYALSAADAHQLTLDLPLSAYFEEVAAHSGNPRSSANYILNDVLREQKNAARGDDAPAIPARDLADLIRLVDTGSMSHTAARSLVEPMLRTGRKPAELMKDAGLEQLHDENALKALVRDVVARSPHEVEKLRAGRKNVFGFLVGEVMKASGGKANPVSVKALLEEALAE